MLSQLPTNEHSGWLENVLPVELRLEGKPVIITSRSVICGFPKHGYAWVQACRLAKALNKKAVGL